MRWNTEEIPGIPLGLEGVKQFLTLFRSAFHDIRFVVEDMIAEGDKVAARITMSGTHRDEFQGIAPTGKQIDVSAQ